MSRDVISFRLRKVDDDLRQAITNVDKDELSALARDGLRYMLGLRTTRAVELRTLPIRPRPTKAPPVWRPPSRP